MVAQVRREIPIYVREKNKIYALWKDGYRREVESLEFSVRLNNIAEVAAGVYVWIETR